MLNYCLQFFLIEFIIFCCLSFGDNVGLLFLDSFRSCSRLQDGVPETIEALREAGIKVYNH